MSHRETAERVVRGWVDACVDTVRIDPEFCPDLVTRIEAALHEAEGAVRADEMVARWSGDEPATQPAPEPLTDVELVAAMVMANHLGCESAKGLAQAQTIVNTLRARRGR